MGKTKEMLVMMGWNWRREVELLLSIDVFRSFYHMLSMNIIVWNCRGALKPNFQSHVRELVRNHNPSIMVVMKTRIGGDRAKEITDRLPFDNAIHTETIGFSGGIWLLWNSDSVEVVQLASTEQEIHVEVKVIVGDFNEPLADEDKFGGRPVSLARSLLFKECLDKCNMVDMGFSGPKYTWTNRRESFWLSDPSFPSVVNQAWRQPRKLMEAIDTFAKKATLWNKNHFGNIFHKKKRIMARLDGVHRVMASDPSASLVSLENQLIKELDVVLEQEKDLWALKSRINWMVLGDRNTAFYHVSAITRRKRNLITTIKNEVGN
ncbi:uncharacterized protein LOC111985234 [Quercus suber]|uniref:uncharacterized protein LOC111985234 n=1 Tax=Quercus suber TaxID=58331 RepID=UPI000CE1F1C8|nr:uncharacterized protein LOC111985234 [Quercus suber]